MAKKGRETSEVEYLRGIVKEQKAQIRHLTKELKRAGKDVRRYNELQDALADEVSFETVTKNPREQDCPQCGKGTLMKERLGVRNLTKCRHCEYSRFEKPSKP